MDIRHPFILVGIGIITLLIGCKSKSDDGETSPKPLDPASLVEYCHLVDGGGAATTGGRGGAIYYITSLADEKDETGLFPVGTLRHALMQSEARTIVFRIAGVIHLKSPLKITNGNVTILGQSAPAGGICIADYPTIIEADNVIIRFMRFRMGDLMQVEGDALSCYSRNNVVLDHCSFSWSTDECVSCYGNKNFTMQWCIISESLRNSIHGKGNHGYGGIWGGKNTTFHHNLLAHHDSRNPRFDHDYVEATNVGPVDFINNVVYNWGGNNCYGGECSSKTGNQRQYNFINNYYKPGPASGRRTQLLAPTTKCSNCTDTHGGTVVPGKFYVTGNIQTASASVTQDNWSGVNPEESTKKSLCKSDSRFTFANCYTGEQSAVDAYQKVLAKAGCSFKRDAVDIRIAQEVRDSSYTYTGSNGSKGGLIDTQSDVGGWPDYTNGDIPIDTDEDGIPDEWERRYGLNPNLFMDARLQSLVKGYLNIELYLSDLVKDFY